MAVNRPLARGGNGFDIVAHNTKTQGGVYAEHRPVFDPYSDPYHDRTG